MSKLYVAVTGGIGSGKSLVLQYLHELKYSVFSCDELYKDIIVTEEYIQKVAKLFPSAVENGEINRKRLSELIFYDDAKRMQLNGIAHPMIMDLLMQKMKEAEGRIIFAEVPLLFEGNYESLFNRILFVNRDKLERAVAVEARDGLSMEHIKKRIDAQFDSESVEGKRRLRDAKVYILNNNATTEKLKEEISAFLNSL